MIKEATRSSRSYDLEQRTSAFARGVREFVRKVPQSLGHLEDCRQVIRSSGSVGANYIEANESLGKKDFIMHIKICRKEAKETCYWLSLLRVDGPELSKEQDSLVQESVELMKIFGAILSKSQ